MQLYMAVKANLQSQHSPGTSLLTVRRYKNTLWNVLAYPLRGKPVSSRTSATVRAAR